MVLEGLGLGKQDKSGAKRSPAAPVFKKATREN